ncbi:MAG: GIY-YIG nuclease family protein, partial [Pseudomonadota bacterium]
CSRTSASGVRLFCLNPDDRVKELGDASVPFGFDTHAMIYSEEAPLLESALHKEFADRRVNSSNFRKEFFRVGLDEVEEAVRRLAPSASFFADREAQEWHETLFRRNKTLLNPALTPHDLPDSI